MKLGRRELGSTNFQSVSCDSFDRCILSMYHEAVMLSTLCGALQVQLLVADTVLHLLDNIREYQHDA